MVRVIQAHNFRSQTTFNLPDDLLLATLISSERILIGRKDGVVDLKALSFHQNNSLEDLQHIEPMHSFSTLSDIEQMVYSTTGHYILTLEYEEGSSNNKYVRAYVNWDPEFINLTTKQVRARVASRVTPSISDQYYFEIIELPITPSNAIPISIGCCQMTGNIVIGLNNATLIFYKFFYRTIDKKPYIDFEQLDYYIQLEYNPLEVHLNENIVIALNNYSLNAFKIVELIDTTDENMSDDAGGGPDGSSTVDGDVLIALEDEGIDLSQNVNYNEILTSLYPLHSTATTKKNGGGGDLIKIHGRSNNQKMNRCSRSRQEVKPTRVADLNAYLYMFNQSDKKYVARSLLKLRMKSDKDTVEITETIKKISVRPMYLKPRTEPEEPTIYRNSIVNCSFTNEKEEIRSAYYRDFLGVGLIVTTAEDGYLYLLEKNEKFTDENGEILLETFTFTAPLIDVILEDALLYVITSVGLEIYTSKIGHYLFNGLMEENSAVFTSPKTEFPVCSVDMRPFFGVRHAFTSNNSLVLLAYSTNRNNT